MLDDQPGGERGVVDCELPYSWRQIVMPANGYISLGYRLVRHENHPRSNKGVYVREHILVAEKALGSPLPPDAVVHHVNERKDDNRNSNLVICQDNAYHRLLHKRMTAYIATGSVHSVMCLYCKQWGLPGFGDLVSVHKKNGLISHSRHRSCHASNERRLRSCRVDS